MAWRVFLHAEQELSGQLLQGDYHERAVEEPVVVGIRVVLCLFKGVTAKIEEEWGAEFGEGFAPDAEGLTAVFEENHFPVAVPDGNDLAVIVDIDELVAW